MKESGQFRENWFFGLGILPTLFSGFQHRLYSDTHKSTLFHIIVNYRLMHKDLFSIWLTLVYLLIERNIDQWEITPIIHKPLNSVYDDLQHYCPKAVIKYFVAILLVNFYRQLSTTEHFWLRKEAAFKTASQFRSMLLRTVKNIGTVCSRTGCRMRRFCALCPVCSFNSIERKQRSADQYNLIHCCFHNVFF